MLLAADNPVNHVTDLVLFHVGPVPITMHTLTILVVAALFVWAMSSAAKAIATGPAESGNERFITKGRFAQFVELVVVYLRDEMLVPVLGEQATRRYLPYLMTVFFFILFMNLFGLIPLADLQHLLGLPDAWIGGTATASITVTAALAFVSFVVIQVHGFKELGVKGYLEHLCGGLIPLPHILLAPVVLIIFVVELAGQFIKPAALAIRLFANMVAGHTLMAVLLGFGGQAARAGMGGLSITGITLISGVAAVGITFLELFVAFLQAFIFMFLTAVFISLLSHHGEEHEHGHDDEAEHAFPPEATQEMAA
ncbi:MAG: F0F1 ATP synthase subunit A [Planctomycetota bacterium]|jgi:F-type H+-transporting ATPase subunit a